MSRFFTFLRAVHVGVRRTIKRKILRHFFIDFPLGYLILILFVLIISSCTAPTLPISPTLIGFVPSPRIVTSTSIPQVNTPSPRVNPSPTLSASTPAPLNLSNPSVVVLAENLPGPDDLVLAPDGSIFVSDINSGSIQKISPTGQLQPVASGLSEPEGMVVLPDGSILIAEQGKNRISRFDPASQQLTPLLQLTNKTGQLGVDGIVLDSSAAHSGTLIIPDSPNGNILRASADGKSVTTLAGGFERPTGAFVEKDGSILVTDENAGALSRIHPDGSIEKLAAFSIPDDVTEDLAGNIFVSALGDHAIHVIPAARQDRTGPHRVTGALLDPQAVILDLDGNLVVADTGHHRVIKIVIRLP